MNSRKKKALEAAGWAVNDTVQEALGLSDQQMVLIEVKLTLARAVKEARARKKLSQTKLAARMSSSQARIARLEQGEASIDRLMSTLLAMGITPKEIGNSIAKCQAH